MDKWEHKILIYIQKHLGLVLFVSMGIIALFTFDKYGMSWDEIYQREIGVVNLEYISSLNQPLLDHFYAKDYGVAFELPLIIIEKLLKLS
ncbi:hypothetical protein KKF86_05170, partial [bacterium]|nr:hypothetical protein [bacterium]